MPGFSDSLSNAQDLVFCHNADFSGNLNPLMLNGLQLNGQLWIGATIANAGGTHINVGTLTSPLGTLSIGYSGGNITLDTMGGSSAIEKIKGNDGVSELPDGSGTFNFLTANTTVKFAGSLNTETLNFGLTNLLLGSSGSAIAGALFNTAIGISALSALTSGGGNTAIGALSGQALTSGNNNILLGTSAGTAMTSSQFNISIGAGSLQAFTTGAANTGSNLSIGYASLGGLLTGVRNLALGTSSGNLYAGAESDNILISSPGVAAESNTMRIGVSGTGSQQVSKAFIAAITGVTVAASAPVGVNASGQLSSLGFGTIAQVFTSNGALASPTWKAPAVSVDLHVARYIVSPGGAADGANYTTIATAYAAAVAAGAPQTVFIQPGTYIENITATSGIHLKSWCTPTNTSLNPVIINGTITYSGADAIVIEGICLETNGATASLVASSGYVTLLNCMFENGSNTAMTLTGAQVTLQDCVMTGQPFALFSISTNGGISINGGHLNYSTVASTASAGFVTIFNSRFDGPITTSGTATFSADNTYLGAELIHGGSGTPSYAKNCHFNTGANAAVSVGASGVLTLSNCVITSSATDVITGAGTVNIQGVSYAGTSSLVNTTTQAVLPTNKGAYIVTLPAGNYTQLATDEIIGATSSGARAITLMTSPATGQLVTIKDVTGTANTHNITITPAAGNIDGSATYVISTAYGSVDLWYSGTQWFAK
jgi:hypothetical protein